ncbi:hypothetical protein DH2020_045970 [Rehmannia glutinosa]|uniref:DUF4283 domain-containing protein n=1 Tax=Rehmannia glutinosa TaxID=99300 RepID=A0ABR0UCN0_REHGL
MPLILTQNSTIRLDIDKVQGSTRRGSLHWEIPLRAFVLGFLGAWPWVSHAWSRLPTPFSFFHISQQQQFLRPTRKVMAEELEKLYARLSLAPSETNPIRTDSILHVDANLHLGLVGKLLAPRIIQADQITTLFKRLWNLKGPFSCKTIQDNIFFFSFDSVLDKKRVLAGAPWLFDKYLLVLHEALADVNPADIRFTHCDFWIQLHHLPLGLMNTSFAETAGNTIGHFLETDTDTSGSVIGRFLRIKVSIDITKPLIRIIHADVHGQKRAIFLKYERLPDFCFHCGIIGHILKDRDTRILNLARILVHLNMEFGSSF